jgi:hypothetical protein
MDACQCQTFLSSFLSTAEHMHDVRHLMLLHAQRMHDYSDLALL